MKMKKLLALVLSAIMAVSMLTACGGGGKAGALNLSEVNSIIHENGGETDVKSSTTLNNALKSVANTLKQSGNYNSDAAMAALTAIRHYPIQENGNNWLSYRAGGAYAFSDAEMKAEGLTAEKIIALAILTSEEALENQLAGEDFQNIKITNTFYAGAETVTATNGALYWIIGFEFETKATA